MSTDELRDHLNRLHEAACEVIVAATDGNLTREQAQGARADARAVVAAADKVAPMPTTAGTDVREPSYAEAPLVAFRRSAGELISYAADRQLTGSQAETAFLGALAVQSMVAPLVDAAKIGRGVLAMVDEQPARPVSAGPHAVPAGEGARRRMDALAEVAATRMVTCQMAGDVCVTTWHRHELDDALTAARASGRCATLLIGPHGEITGVCSGQLDGQGRCEVFNGHGDVR